MFCLLLEYIIFLILPTGIVFRQALFDKDRHHGLDIGSTKELSALLLFDILNMMYFSVDDWYRLKHIVLSSETRMNEHWRYIKFFESLKIQLRIHMRSESPE